jgi:dihydrofolate reductase
MRRLVATENISLDGVLDAQDNWFTPYDGDDIAAVTREHMAAADAVLTGSVTLVRSLASQDLIDVYRLFVSPVVLGRGRRLFPDGRSSKLRLIDSRPFRSGVVLLSYQSARCVDAAPH